METRGIGSLQASVIGLGCNNFGMRIDQDATVAVVDAAIEHGINLLDTADSYGGGKSERFLRVALEGRRDRVLVATKFGSKHAEGEGGAKPDYVRSAAQRSLERLGVERIDLYQLHFPDPSTPIEATLEALAGLVAEGLVTEIGCSNFSAAQLDEAEAAGRRVGVRFVSVQNHLSLVDATDVGDGLAASERLGLGYLPYFPLASGLLTGKYRRDAAPPAGTRLAAPGWGERSAALMSGRNFDLVDALSDWAGRHGRTIGDLAHAWLLAHPAVSSVISGATSPAQVAANASSGGWVLTPSQREEVGAIRAAVLDGPEGDGL